MATVIRIILKDFNPAKLAEELAALPIASLLWAGFTPSGDRRYSPFPEATRVIGRSSVAGDDVAQRGELRFTMTRELTTAEVLSLDAILAAHDPAILTAEQVRQDQDEADLDQLVTDFPGWEALSTPQKLAALKRLLRVFIRRERRAAV